ncbi:hypothetical protein TorRG33x02_309050 [Trema orientale]|uniref:RNase H type-1 domain-containing protein n=1 Tax=Trema orientale TaxID=63057 RepID=A0A2P5BU08_TREOI|nr:hypothetical protein TorRG33x02_309050 [Trema orientale]
MMQKKIIDPPLPIAVAKPPHWIKQERRKLKLNSNAAILSQLGCIGIGCLIHDEDGIVLAIVSQRMPSSFSPLMAELIAIKEGLLFTTKIHFTVNIVESDCSNDVSVNSSNSVSSNNLIASDIAMLLTDFGARTGCLVHY